MKTGELWGARMRVEGRRNAVLSMFERDDKHIHAGKKGEIFWGARVEKKPGSCECHQAVRDKRLINRPESAREAIREKKGGKKTSGMNILIPLRGEPPPGSSPEFRDA